MKLWKRNAVVAVIVLFVCAAAYLNWSYSHDGKISTDAGKILGQATLVGNSSDDTLLKNDSQQTAEPQATGQDQDQSQDQAQTTESGYFANARLNRQQARDSALSLLQQAASDEKADADAIQKANEAIQTMAANTLSEAQIENLVTAKGYTNCVAFLGDGTISVVVSSQDGTLTDADIARISEIVKQETGLSANQIKIIQSE
ncbi:MAG: SpoIIIAH-like family protein [Intestinimonas sp.]|jgi:stage III sporulation protein AH|nr:SpoIIIAH-like family protein [Intestinimonas sp.]